MKRVYWVALVILIVVMGGVLPVWAQGGDGEGGEGDELAAVRGAALFAEFCQACHAPDGGAVAEGPAFATVIDYNEESALHALESGVEGEDGVFMSAYDSVLHEEELTDLLAYLATWESGEVPELPEPNVHVAVDEAAHGEGAAGDPQAGAVLYAKTCYGCHAAEGAGRDAEGFPAFEWSQASLEVVSAGGELGLGHAFGAEAGGPLDETELHDLEAYIATWGAEEHAAAEEGDTEVRGLDILLVVIGVAAILIVGGAYGTNIIRTET